MPYTPFDWADGAAGGTPITAERLDAIETGIARASHWYDVREYGAVGDGVTDDTTALADAMDAARMSSSRRGGHVYLPPGRYLISAPIPLYTAVSITGGGWSLDTSNYHTSALVADAGFVGDALLLLDADGATVPSPPGPDDSWHWGVIERLAFVGNGTSGPHGLDPGWSGEATAIRNCQFYNLNAGIYLNSVQASTTLEAVSFFDCSIGLHCDGINGSVRAFGLSGDNNGNLVKVKGGVSANVTIVGLKAESYDVGTGDPVVHIDDLDGGAVTILGGWVDTDAARSDVIKLSKTGATSNYPRVLVQGLDCNSNYTNLINDTIATKTVTRALSALSYAGLQYNVTNVIGGQGELLIANGNSISGVHSGGTKGNIVTMETDDSSSFKATASTAGGRLKSVSGTSQVRWNNTGLGFFGGTPVAKPSVTGSRGGNAALASLLTQLAALGLITDSSSA